MIPGVNQNYGRQRRAQGFFTVTRLAKDLDFRQTWDQVLKSNLDIYGFSMEVRFRTALYFILFWRVEVAS